MIVVATKLDATTDRTRLEALRDFCERRGLEFHSISAVSGEGVKELVRSIADTLDKIPRATPDATLEAQPAAVVQANTSRDHEPLRAAAKLDPSPGTAAEDENS